MRPRDWLDWSVTAVTDVPSVAQAPEFVRKHILNKHGDKVSAVRQEVLFFNNFLLDAKRPALPENKPLPPPVQGEPRTKHRKRLSSLCRS